MNLNVPVCPCIASSLFPTSPVCIESIGELAVAQSCDLHQQRRRSIAIPATSSSRSCFSNFPLEIELSETSYEDDRPFDRYQAATIPPRRGRSGSFRRGSGISTKTGLGKTGTTAASSSVASARSVPDGSEALAISAARSLASRSSTCPPTRRDAQIVLLSHPNRADTLRKARASPVHW